LVDAAVLHRRGGEGGEEFGAGGGGHGVKETDESPQNEMDSLLARMPPPEPTSPKGHLTRGRVECVSSELPQRDLDRPPLVGLAPSPSSPARS
jgi:hypothetical protein